MTLVSPSFSFSGDIESAKLLKSRGLKLYQLIAKQAENAGLGSTFRTETLPDKSIIKAKAFRNNSYNYWSGAVDIFSPYKDDIKFPDRIDLIVSTISGTFKVKRRGGSVYLSNFNLPVGFDFSWRGDAVDLVCSYDSNIEAIIIAGVPIFLPEEITNYGIVGGAALTRESGVAIVYTEPYSLYTFNNKMESQYIGSLSFDTVNQVIISKDSTPSNIILYIIYNDTNLIKRVYTLSDSAYNFSDTILDTINLPVQTNSIVTTKIDNPLSCSPEPGYNYYYTCSNSLDYNSSITTSVTSGSRYIGMLCDTYNSATIAILGYSGNSTTINHFDNDSSTTEYTVQGLSIPVGGISGYWNLVNTRNISSIINESYNYNLSIFNGVNPPISKSRSNNTTHLLNRDVNIGYTQYVIDNPLGEGFSHRNDYFITKTGTSASVQVTANTSSTISVVFADAQCTIYRETKTIHTGSTQTAEMHHEMFDNGTERGINEVTNRLTQSPGSITTEMYDIIIINGKEAYREKISSSTIPGYSNTPLNYTVNFPNNSNTTSSLGSFFFDSPALGHSYAYTDRLYAVNLFGKIIIFPIENGRVYPTILKIISGPQAFTKLALHRD